MWTCAVERPSEPAPAVLADPVCDDEDVVALDEAELTFVMEPLAATGTDDIAVLPTPRLTLVPTLAQVGPIAIDPATPRGAAPMLGVPAHGGPSVTAPMTLPPAANAPAEPAGATVVALDPRAHASALEPAPNDADEPVVGGTVVALNPLLQVPADVVVDAPRRETVGHPPPPPRRTPPPPPPPRSHHAVPRRAVPDPTMPVVIGRGMPGRPRTRPPEGRESGKGVRATFLGGYLRDTTGGTEVRVGENESLEVGSKPGSPFSADPYVSRYHAALVPVADGVAVEDFGTTNGIYMRVDTPTEVRDGDRIRVGRQILQVNRLSARASAEQSVRPLASPNPGWWARVAIMLDDTTAATAAALAGDEAILGQREGVLDLSHDDRVAARHCRLSRDGDRIEVEDLGSPRGTWIRVRGGDVVPYGREILIGDTRLRVDRI